MKTININISCFLILFFVISACSNKTQEISNKEDIEDNNSDVITITEKQFEASGYQIGGFEKKSFKSVLKVNGMIQMPMKNRAAISSFIGGEVSRMNLIHGQKVNKGQRLFTLTNPELVNFQQEYLELKGQLIYLNEQYLRQKTLSEENISAVKNFQKAESELRVAEAKFASVGKKLELIGIQLDKISTTTLVISLEIIAPKSGYVSSIHVVSGAFLNPSEVAMEIDNMDHLHLELKVMERDLSKVMVDQKLSFQVLDDPTHTFEAEVHLIEKLIDEDRMVNLHCHLSEKDEGKFIPGMFVSAEIEIEERESMALPSQSVVNMSLEHFVLQLEKKGSLNFYSKQIIPGQSQNGYTEILNSKDFNQDAQFLVEGAYYVKLGE